MGIDTEAVLQADSSKWNFLPLRPGLVGGHCIGVDSYYLTHKAQTIGYHPEIILAEYNIEVDVCDPWVSKAEAQHECGIDPVEQPKPGQYEGVILALGPNQFKALGATGIRSLVKSGGVVYDLKYTLSVHESDIRL
jgi:UDP-N-acetyl-D-mannosaminuronate dehydrogenase